ncbi:hypothetical protein Hanom_Chr05g00423171 [Helianthus anomalus]
MYAPIFWKPHPRTEPERTHWRPSMKFDAARIGIMVATYFTTSTSLLYAYPQKLRINIKTDPTKIPTIMTTTSTTITDNRAVRGCPAPNSFETRVLRKSRIINKKLTRI